MTADGQLAIRSLVRFMFGLLLSIMCGTVTMAASDHPSDKKSSDVPLDEVPAVGNRPFLIPEAEIPKLQEQALKGSGAAAYRLAQYYDFAVFDYEQGLYWITLAAENGDIRGVYGLGVALARSQSDRDKVRARYWLEKARREGTEPIASLADRVLKNLGDR